MIRALVYGWRCFRFALRFRHGKFVIYTRARVFGSHQDDEAGPAIYYDFGPFSDGDDL